jgi:hypothetical protein
MLPLLKRVRAAVWVGVSAVALLLLDMLCFPETGAAGVALVLSIALMGAAVASEPLRQRMLGFVRARTQELPGWIAGAGVVLSIAVASARLFGKAWNESGYSRYDWSPHHANLKNLVGGLVQGRIPRWVHNVSTGDATYELYSLLPYYLAARVAQLCDSEDLKLLLVRSGILIHTLGAISAALLARRVLDWRWGIAVGLVTLYDFGSVYGGGADGLLGFGVTHSALANALFPFVLISLLDALERPSLAVSVRIWLLTALTIACHPLGLVSAAGAIVSLGFVAWLAKDVPAHRALLAMGHLMIGIGACALVWVPFGQRLLAYGVHYALPGELAEQAFANFLKSPVPDGTLLPLIVVGYVGMLAGWLSRRAAPTLLACFATVLLLGLIDQPYTLLDLSGSLGSSRFQSVRLASAAKVSVYVCAALLFSTLLTNLTRNLRAQDRLRFGALAAVCLFLGVRVTLPYFDKLAAQIRQTAHWNVPETDDLERLIAWAKVEAGKVQPGAYARLLDQDPRRFYEVYHLNAESRLPALWFGSASAIFLRERIEDLSPESLARFNVRWIMQRGAPPAIGDASKQLQFGSYYLREVPGWDGRFARIERGGGSVMVTRLDNDQVDVELRGTDQPALVALGTGYYPRWQAWHAERALPVYAHPTIPGGKLRVPAAWIPPGRTSFRPTGSLPSDGSGTPVSVLALVAALGVVVLEKRASLRRRALRYAARARTWLTRHRFMLGAAAALAVSVVLLVTSISAKLRAAPAMKLGNGLLAAARVSARATGGDFRECEYSPLRGGFRCRGAVSVKDTLGSLLNDAPPSTAFAVPVVRFEPGRTESEVRVRLRTRLTGEYWAATNGPPVIVTVEGREPVSIDHQQRELSYPAGTGTLDVTIQVKLSAGSPVELAFVRRNRLDPERNYPSAPETNPFARGAR